MKLLQHAWSDMLVLDHIHQRLHVGLLDETTLPNGQKFDMLSLALLGVPSVADQLHQVTQCLQELKFDPNDYICLKFLLLLNPGIIMRDVPVTFFAFCTRRLRRVLCLQSTCPVADFCFVDSRQAEKKNCLYDDEMIIIVFFLFYILSNS